MKPPDRVATGAANVILSPVNATDPLLGRLLGGTYGIERPLGQGGFGTVYIARHARTGKRYAVKVLRADRVGVSEQVMVRFRREAETLAALGHPGIVAIHDFASTDDGVEYLVMDLLEGEDLAQRLERVGRMSLDEAIALMKQLASALGAAHGQGIMHRDLKPANVFLKQIPGEGERATILDFGLAKMMDEATEERLTASGVAMGTPQYMSPEQASGAVLDHRTDIYALASIFYEAVAGTPPFEAPTMSALMVKILTAPPPPLSTRVPVPPHVDDAVSRALAKNPEERYAHAASFVAALEGREPSMAQTRRGPVPMTRELEAAQAAALVTHGAGQTAPQGPDQAETTAPMPNPETPHAWSVARGVTPEAQPVAKQPGKGLFLLLGAAVLLLAILAGGGAVWIATSDRNRGDDEGGEVAMAAAPSEVATIPEPVVAPEVENEAVTDAALAPDAAALLPPDLELPPPHPSTTTGGSGRRRRSSMGSGGGGSTQAAAAPTPAPAPAATPAPAAAAVQIPEATRAQYRAQIAQYEGQNREIDALLERIDSLRPMVRGLGEARRPSLCDGSGLRAMSQSSDVPIVVSQQQRIRSTIERTCEPFERLQNTPPEIRRDLDSIDRTLDRAEEMTRSNVSSNQPVQVAEQVRDAIGEARRTLAGVQEGRRPFPCNAPVFRRLRTLQDAGNTYSGAAARRVTTLRNRICGRLGTDVDDLRQSERRFLQTLDDTEGTLRQTQRSFREVIDRLRPWAG
jgi:serine/threonine-protein kinase